MDTLSKAGHEEDVEVPRVEINAASTIAASEDMTTYQRCGKYAALVGRLPEDKKKKVHMETAAIALV